ncbi:MAG: threonine aldolase family protein [Nocardioides sp.]
MTDFDDRFRAAADACDHQLPWQPRGNPAETLAALARACDELGIDAWDTYADGGAVTRLETEVAELLGTEDAVFFVSGTMAQQSVLRVWCERRGTRRVAIQDASHLLAHEGDGPRLLHDLRFEPLTRGAEVATGDALRAMTPGLGAALVELPLRHAACALPTWDQLTDLSAAARQHDVPLHMDGARLWESMPFYDRPLPEVVGLFDTVYVSFYKGLAAPAGAAVVGPKDVMDELRVWRHRMGGRLFRMTPYALGALVGLRDKLPLMGEYAAWARAFAGELVAAGLRVAPEPPHTNTFQVFLETPLPALQERLIAFMEREKVQPSGIWWETEVPGVCVTEVSCYDSALRHDPATVAGWYAELAGS